MQTLPFAAAASLATPAQAQSVAASNDLDWINIKDYGAVGDGVADDTLAIQLAINASPTSGGAIYVPPGSYVLSSALLLKPNITLFGCGATSKLWPRTSGQSAFKLINTTLIDANIEISSIEIDARSATGICAIEITLARYLRFDQIIFTGCNFNTKLDRCRIGFITDCLSRGNATNRGGTLLLYSTAAGSNQYIFEVSVSNYTAFNVGNGTANGHAIVVSRGVAVLISGVTLNDGHVGGDIRVIGFYGDCQGCKVSNGTVSGAIGVFFGLDPYTTNTTAPSFCTITNFDVDQARSAAIWIAAGERISVNGGNLTASGVNPSATGVLVQSGIRISLSGLTIHGFSAPTGNGILIGSAVQQAKITDCRIEACGVGIGVVSGAGQFFSIIGNQINGNTNPINYGGSMTNCIVKDNVGSPNIIG